MTADSVSSKTLTKLALETLEFALFGASSPSDLNRYFLPMQICSDGDIAVIAKTPMLPRNVPNSD